MEDEVAITSLLRREVKMVINKSYKKLNESQTTYYEAGCPNS
jgi:hypothetical protein